MEHHDYTEMSIGPTVTVKQTVDWMLDLDESDKEVTLHVREPFLSPQIISDGVSTGLEDSGLTPWPKTNRMNPASHGGDV